MEELIELLQKSGCSLVVQSADGDVTTYNKKGVRDLIWLIDNEPQRLKGSSIADKVIGKAAAGLLTNSGVARAYAAVMSAKAVDLFNREGFKAYSYGTLVNGITIPEGSTRCHLEEIVSNASNANDVERMLRNHFDEMRRKNAQQ